jgi:hypothetical protein
MSLRTKKPVTTADGKMLTPGQVAKMRAGVFQRVRNQIDEAHQVVMGQKEWSPTQARVFATMLNKVMPDLTAQFVQHEHVQKTDMREMSRDELERIAAGVEEIADPIEAEELNDDVIEAASSEVPSQTA